MLPAPIPDTVSDKENQVLFNGVSSKKPPRKRQRKHTIKTNKSDANKCNGCGKGYKQRCHMLRHLKTCRTSDAVVPDSHKACEFTCEYCPVTCQRRDTLKRHIKRCHVGASSHVCNQCQRVFFEAHDLKRHLQSVHTNERGYVCRVCSKAYSQKFALTAHMRLHICGPQPKSGNGRRGYFPCPDCGTVFTRQHTLARHSKTHSDKLETAIPFQCDLCSKRFTRTASMLVHRSNCARKKRQNGTTTAMRTCILQEANVGSESCNDEDISTDK